MSNEMDFNLLCISFVDDDKWHLPCAAGAVFTVVSIEVNGKLIPIRTEVMLDCNKYHLTELSSGIHGSVVALMVIQVEQDGEKIPEEEQRLTKLYTDLLIGGGRVSPRQLERVGKIDSHTCFRLADN